jgi:hypothetical protein
MLAVGQFDKEFPPELKPLVISEAFMDGPKPVPFKPTQYRNA